MINYSSYNLESYFILFNKKKKKKLIIINNTEYDW